MRSGDAHHGGRDGFRMGTGWTLAQTFQSTVAAVHESLDHRLKGGDLGRPSTTMASEERLSGSYGEVEQVESVDCGSYNIAPPSAKGRMNMLLFHGSSVYDAWLSATSSQIAQVLLTLPTSFAQLGYASGAALQLFYGIMGCWACYMITWLYMEYRTRMEREGHTFKTHVIQWFEVLDGLLGSRWKYVGLAFNCVYLLFAAVTQLIACGSNIFLLNDTLDKREWTYVFGACCLVTIFIPSFRYYRLYSFFGVVAITYTSWYMTVSALVYGQVPGATHDGPTSLVLYFTGATNMLYTFGSHAVTVEIMHAMYRPVKFKYAYLFATLYIFTLTIPSSMAVYWSFGDSLLDNANALQLLPKSPARDVAVLLMLIHQFITVGFAVTPLYFVWEKVLGVHQAKSMLLRASCRMPVILPIWFFAVAFPFFGSINSVVGCLLVTFTVYIIPCLAHMVYFCKASIRAPSVEKPPFFLPSWTAVYVVNILVIAWAAAVGVGFGGWASISTFIKQIRTFGVFAACYQCPQDSR